MNQPVTLEAVLDTIREVGSLASLEAHQDFYEAGLSSVQALPLLMEFEDRFGVSIPDDRFIHARTASSVSTLLAELKG